MKVHFGVALCVFCWMNCLAPVQNSAPASSPAVTQYLVNVSATRPWTDTHVDLRPGEALQITATSAAGDCSSDGMKISNPRVLTIPSAAPDALIGKLAENTAPFLVGSGKQVTIVEPGHLFLGMNAGSRPSCSGSITAKLQLTPAVATASVTSKLNKALQTWLYGQFGIGVPQTPPSPGSPGSTEAGGTKTASASAASAPKLSVSKIPLDPQFAKDLEGIPRRVSDEFNNLGDMVNFVIVGPQEELQTVLAAADWHIVDQTTEATVISAILHTYENKDYVQMPISILYLFKRPQDFGYVQAEAFSVVASRHHFRLWKASFAWNGQPVWIGAGTHDVGFEKDQRNGKVTHKIDPAVDIERDHIGQTLEKTGKVKAINYYHPPDPVLEAKNATGGSYHSDGRLLIVFLK